MPLRRRLALIAAASVAVAVLIAALVCYLVVRDQLRSQIDGALRAQAFAVQHGDLHAIEQTVPGIPARAGGPAQYVQVVTARRHRAQPRGRPDAAGQRSCQAGGRRLRGRR